MNRLIFLAVIPPIVLMVLLVSVRMPYAGVVMAETSTASGPAGKMSQNRIVYIQGNKQKIETQGIDAITDLDKGVLYVIDKNYRAYLELPVRVLTFSQSADLRGETMPLNKTGAKRIIAHQSCTEYAATAGTESDRVTVSVCVSITAPGANQVAAFEHKMASGLNGDKSSRSAKNASAALILEKQSVVSFRVPDMSQRNTYRTASLLVKTCLNDIQ
jgi:hypothetical protein